MADSQPVQVRVREAARLLSVHENTVYRWIKDGTLEATMLPGGRNLRVLRSSIDRFLTANKVEPEG